MTSAPPAPRREREAAPAYVSVGSNVGDAARNAIDAIGALGRQDGLEVTAVSSLYETDPVGCPPGSAPFVNAAARISTALDAHRLLGRLARVEREMGRVRPARRNMPRVIDLDLLMLGDEAADTPGLRLPHPRMHLRAFVLRPLSEIEPSLVIPGHGPVSDLLGRCSGQGVRLLEEAAW